MLAGKAVPQGKELFPSLVAARLAWSRMGLQSSEVSFAGMSVRTPVPGAANGREAQEQRCGSERSSASPTQSRRPALTPPPAGAADHAMGSVTAAGWDGEMG